MTTLKEKERVVGAINCTRYVAYSQLKKAALEMRRGPTAAERRMWSCLRGEHLGARFRRQHVIGKFIVDFMCLENRLVVEIDGSVHDSQKEADRAREDYLKSLGLKVIRFRNEQVMNDIRSVKLSIKQNLESISQKRDNPL